MVYNDLSNTSRFFGTLPVPHLGCSGSPPTFAEKNIGPLELPSRPCPLTESELLEKLMEETSTNRYDSYGK